MNTKSLAEKLQKVEKMIRNAQDIVVVSHRNPDGDTIGANIALAEIIRSYFGKRVNSACVDTLPSSLRFLPGSAGFRTDFAEDADLIIIVDCGSLNQTRFNEKITEAFENNISVINIDHHPSNEYFGTLNVVMPEAAATCEMIYYFARHLNIKISKSMATAILTGLYTDTGSFMHSNTTESVYQIAAHLMGIGANFKHIVKYVFKTKSIEQLRLWGRVLENAKLNDNGTIVSKVTKEDFGETEAAPEHLSGVVNYLTSVPESTLSVLLTENGQGQVKGSLRTLGDNIDVSEICGKFGGGGHKKAAGFTIPGRIVEKRIWTIE